MTAPSQSAPVAPANGAPKLKRSIGLWMATALVVGNMIGSGVFLLPATLAGTAGPISMLGWLFTGQGGPYAYARRAFGDNILGARESGIVQLATTVLKFVPLAVIAIVGLFFIDGGNYEPFAPNGASLSLLSTTAALTLWAFIGLESATVPADEVKDPERTIPRATIIGTVLATLLYLVATAAIMGIIPTDQLAASTSPFADAAGEAFGGGWDKVIAAIALVSTFGALNGWILLQGRVPMAAAEDGMFPAPFAKVHGKRRTPVFGLVVSSVLVTGLMLMNYTKGLVGAFEFVILLATLTTLVPYAFSAAAQAWLWLVERETFRPLHLVRDVVIATLAFAYSVWAIAGAGDDIVTKGFILLLAGIPVYIGMRWWERRKLEHLPIPPPTRERPVVMAGDHDAS